jgi:hypothetical protein
MSIVPDVRLERHTEGRLSAGRALLGSDAGQEEKRGGRTSTLKEGVIILRTQENGELDQKKEVNKRKRKGFL